MWLRLRLLRSLNYSENLSGDNAHRRYCRRGASFHSIPDSAHYRRLQDRRVRSVAVFAAIALTMMFVGAIGLKAAPPQYFGIVERFSVFAAVGFNAVPGLYLFGGFKKASLPGQCS